MPLSGHCPVLFLKNHSDLGGRWAHQDLNLEPTDYESAALTVELWAREPQSSIVPSPPRGTARSIRP